MYAGKLVSNTNQDDKGRFSVRWFYRAGLKAVFPWSISGSLGSAGVFDPSRAVLEGVVLPPLLVCDERGRWVLLSRSGPDLPPPVRLLAPETGPALNVAEGDAVGAPLRIRRIRCARASPGKAVQTGLRESDLQFPLDRPVGHGRPPKAAVYPSCRPPSPHIRTRWTLRSFTRP